MKIIITLILTSPTYIHTSQRVGEIHRYNPKMKIIILYRDEVDRAWSAFLMWNRINKVSVEEMTEDEVFEKLSGAYYMSRSDLGEGLTNFVNLFGEDQVIVADFKDVAERPQHLMNVVFDFLGVQRLAIEEGKLKTNFQILSDRTAVVENKRNSAPDGLKVKLQERLADHYRDMKRKNKKVAKGFLERYREAIRRSEGAASSGTTTTTTSKPSSSNDL